MRKYKHESWKQDRPVVLLVFGTLLVLLIAGVAAAFAADGMMGVGRMMGPGDSAGGGPPPETFYLTNDTGDILTNDAGTNRITTQ